jgi:hypothetical protein
MFTLATLHEEGSDIRVPPWDLSPPLHPRIHLHNVDGDHLTERLIHIASYLIEPL